VGLDATRILLRVIAPIVGGATVLNHPLAPLHALDYVVRAFAIVNTRWKLAAPQIIGVAFIHGESRGNKGGEAKEDGGETHFLSCRWVVIGRPFGFLDELRCRK
jgi:hypothetical protein